MGMFLATNVDKQAMLPAIEVAVKNLFHDPADAFFTGRVMDLLFDGDGVDCSTDDQVSTAICVSFETNRALWKTEEKHFKFSLFGGVSTTFKLLFPLNIIN